MQFVPAGSSTKGTTKGRCAVLQRDGTTETATATSRPEAASGDASTTFDRAQSTLRRAYEKTRAFTEELAAPLSAEDQTVQTMPDVSPTKWHRGHVTWFFETFLLERGLSGYEPFDTDFGYIFNSYYEALGARHPRPERGHLSRPGIADVAAYREHVDGAMTALLDRPLDPDLADLAVLGINHEEQHQELLLMDVKHVLSRNPMGPSYASGAVSGQATVREELPKIGWIEHDGGPAEIGHTGRSFAFDNESPRHTVQLAPFALADRLVTCGEWQEFIDDGGYTHPELWLSDGWAAVRALGWTGPLYWERMADDGTVFTLNGARPADHREPVVHVSYYEADAFARWSGARLPTEAEWETIATDVRSVPRPEHRLHPLPAGEGTRAADFYGSVWQWTSSSYSPYPGFRPAPGAVGEYNGKFMVNQQVLRGSACITPPGHERPTYRNFFPAGARWAFSGVRLARDL